MASDIPLTQSVVTSLLALQNTTNQVEKVQTRLSTGLKVQSALDDAIKFFTAKGLQDLATDYTTVKDSIQQGISTLKTAATGIESIDAISKQMKGIVKAAQATSDTGELTRLAGQFNDLQAQINSLASDTEYNGVNLIQGGTADDLIIVFNNDSTSSITIAGIESDSTALGFTTADFSTPAGIASAATEVDNALAALRTSATTLGSNMALLTTRLEFTNQYVSNLNEGAGNLTLADANEEGANLLALQTRQQLATNALALAAQNERSVLSLFR